MLRRPTAELTANTGVKTQEKRQVSKQTEIVLYWSVLTSLRSTSWKLNEKISIIKYRSVLYQSYFSTISCNQLFAPVENKSGQFLVKYASNLIHRDYTNFWKYDTAFTESCNWFSRHRLSICRIDYLSVSLLRLINTTKYAHRDI